ncbi:DMT family transporter [Aureibacter tunicatorum]|uniref:Transporter family-2 protein n=1 Tax=Aureibacter tunicatorum TaxID=866807 RepID=A0AAE4BS05_9BACT|nr:DMT family transporter [Aureibacter tunicatorum]MDR6239246.1 transporter family-2 protein [Aureibacter tunicatorum]BDD04829.1 DMT family transporter [Aureibacter tunicatorum]
MSLYLILMAIVAGCCIPCQGTINAKLSEHMNHPFQVAFFSFFVANVLIGIYLLVSGETFPSFSTLTNITWYLYTGGLLGIVFITSVMLLIPKLGVATTLSFAIVGQLVCSLILDQIGLFGMKTHPINLQKIIGVICLLVGLYLIKHEKGAVHKSYWIFFAFAIGFITPFQGNINAELNHYVGNPLIATFLSFSGATIFLSIYLLLFRVKFPANMMNVPFYLYFSGFFGTILITLVLYLIPKIGVSLTVAGVITGQLTCSVLIDRFGILGVKKRLLTIHKVVGILALAVGLIFMQI